MLNHAGDGYSSVQLTYLFLILLHRFNQYQIAIKTGKMKTFRRILLAVIVVAVLAIAYVLVFVYYKPHVNYLKAAAEVEVTGEQLFRDFVNDPSKAAGLYNGKVLLVEGTVDEIEEAGDMVIAVMIFDDGFFGAEGVRFTMLEGQEKFLVTGQPMHLKGYCTGFTGADVIIEHASVVQQ